MSKQIQRLMEQRTPLVPQCMKNEIEDKSKVTFCSRADGNFCGAYAWPEKKWRVGECPLADEALRTHTEEQVAQDKIRVGQQKQKKKK